MLRAVDYIQFITHDLERVLAFTCRHWASQQFLVITRSFLLLSISTRTASTKDILLALYSLKSLQTPSWASSVIPTISSSFLILRTILKSFGLRVQWSLCMHRRLAQWIVSTTYCSVPHLRARMASLVILKFPQFLIASQTNTVKGAKGRRGSTLVCHLCISCKALSLEFFLQGGVQPFESSWVWTVFLGTSPLQ